MKNVYIKHGFWSKVKGSLIKPLDLRKFITDLLTSANVPFVADETSCCTETPVGQPVRYTTENGLEVFDGEDWVSLPTEPQVGDLRVTEDEGIYTLETFDGEDWVSTGIVTPEGA